MSNEYPKMLYREGGDLADHKVNDTPLLIGGKFACETRIVEDAEEESEALSEGWTVAPDPGVRTAAQISAAREAEKDAEIALLKAQLAEKMGSAFDHDGDGKPGGSKPRKRSDTADAALDLDGKEQSNGDAA